MHKAAGDFYFLGVSLAPFGRSGNRPSAPMWLGRSGFCKAGTGVFLSERRSLRCRHKKGVAPFAPLPLGPAREKIFGKTGLRRFAKECVPQGPWLSFEENFQAITLNQICNFQVLPLNLQKNFQVITL